MGKKERENERKRERERKGRREREGALPIIVFERGWWQRQYDKTLKFLYFADISQSTA